MNLVINASPLIFLSKIEIIQCLPEIIDNLVIPKAVISEVEKHKDEAHEWLKTNKKSFERVVGNVPVYINAWDLGKGESEVIAYANKNKDFVAALDDKAARNCAASMQINVVGTIGLIIIAKRRKVITDAKGYLEKLKNTGFRISDQLFDYAIKLANQ